jgi:hypothetical protein
MHIHARGCGVYADANGYAYGYDCADNRAIEYAYPHKHTYTDTYTDANGYAYGHTDGNVYTDANRYAQRGTP